MIGRGPGDAAPRGNDSQVARAPCHPRSSAIPRFVTTDLATEAMTPTQTTPHALLAPDKWREAAADARVASHRRVQPAITTADDESPGTTRAERGSLPRDNESGSLRHATRPAAHCSLGRDGAVRTPCPAAW